MACQQWWVMMLKAVSLSFLLFWHCLFYSMHQFYKHMLIKESKRPTDTLLVLYLRVRAIRVTRGSGRLHKRTWQGVWTQTQQMEAYVKPGYQLSIQRLCDWQLSWDGVDNEDARWRLVSSWPSDAVSQGKVFISIRPDLRMKKKLYKQKTWAELFGDTPHFQTLLHPSPNMKDVFQSIPSSSFFFPSTYLSSSSLLWCVCICVCVVCMSRLCVHVHVGARWVQLLSNLFFETGSLSAAGVPWFM